MSTNDILLAEDLADFRVSFARHVRKAGQNDCWEWLSAKDPAGYGQTTFHGSHKAHRIAWVLTNGPIPDSGRKRSLCVCHSCDNRGCMNPAHLFIGTDRDNVNDMVSKGRVQQGERHYAAKLTYEQVTAIRKDRRSDRVVAAEYGVSKGTVAGLRRPGSWPSLGAVKQNPDRHFEAILRGEKVSGAKLTASKVRAIRADPRTVPEIAAKYEVTSGTIAAIKNRRTWAHLPPEPTDTSAALRARGRPKGHATAGYPQKGKLAQLRRAVEAVIANREKMDEGWFVPTEVMAELDKLSLPQ